MEKISQIKSEIVDLDRGRTIAVEVSTEHGFSGRVTLPAGISVGKSEAKLIDPKQAKVNIDTKIAKAVIGADVLEQREVDEVLMDLDGTIDRSKLGVNSLLPVSLAVARAGASAMSRELYEHIAHSANLVAQLPQPVVVLFEGGAHASISKLPIQEISYVGDIEKAMKIHAEIGEKLKHKGIKFQLGGQGGYDANLQDSEIALNLMMQAAERLNISQPKFALDIAASHQNFSLKELNQLLKKFPIQIIEDPIDQADLKGWINFTKEFGQDKLVAADDLTVGDPIKIKEAVKSGVANCLVIKLNQAATLSEMFDLINLVKVGDWAHIVSHRGHESMDDFITDLAVGTGAGFFKAGTMLKPERKVKYERLQVIAKSF